MGYKFFQFDTRWVPFLFHLHTLFVHLSISVRVPKSGPYQDHLEELSNH
jgi:hypothetical protein